MADGTHILVYSQPRRQKLRNIRRNPRVALNFSSNVHGGDVVRAERTAEILEEAPLATEVPECVEKCQTAMAWIVFDSDGFAQAYSVAIRVVPTHWQIL